jgi:hypothetical protein
MSMQVWLAGSLVKHRRGKVLRDLLGAEPAVALPEGHGLCLAFAADFQDAEPSIQDRWLAWTLPAGRTLLLLPPLKPGDYTRPLEWKAESLAEPCLGAEGSLPALLAPEVRYRLVGHLQSPDDPSGRWDGGAMHTGYHRRHPAAGIFAVTCLPLWSAALLGRQVVVNDWLGRLHELAGTPAALDQAPEAGFTPSADHWAVLLHLCAGRFSGREQALTALAVSPLFSVPPERADTCLRELEAQGLAQDGGPTEAGRSQLAASPYAVYLEALEAVQT